MSAGTYFVSLEISKEPYDVSRDLIELNRVWEATSPKSEKFIHQSTTKDPIKVQELHIKEDKNMKQIKFPPDGVEKTKCPNAVHLGGVLGKVERHLGVRVYMLENF